MRTAVNNNSTGEIILLVIIQLIGERNGYPSQYSCWENSMDGGAWQATIHGVTESQTRLSNQAGALVIHGHEIVHSSASGMLHPSALSLTTSCFCQVSITISPLLFLRVRLWDTTGLSPSIIPFP